MGLFDDIGIDDLFVACKEGNERAIKNAFEILKSCDELYYNSHGMYRREHGMYRRGLYRSSYPPYRYTYIDPQLRSKVNKQDEEGNTLLHIACKHTDNGNIISILLNNDCDPYIENKKNQTPLIIAGIYGHISQIRSFVEYNKDIINYENCVGYTVLLGVCKNCCKCICEKCEKRLKFNDDKISEGEFKMETVRYLLDNGADPNKSEIRTPLTYACIRFNKELVELLLNNGANPNIHKDEDITPLIAVCGFGGNPVHNEIIKLLLEYNANPNSQNKFGDTAILKLVELFICNDFEEKCIFESIMLLINYGAEPTIKNIFGTSAFNYAEDAELDNIVSVFKMFGFNN